jgi:hypothetical protein
MLVTALAIGGGIHEQTLRFRDRVKRLLDWVSRAYQGGNIIVATQV